MKEFIKITKEKVILFIILLGLSFIKNFDVFHILGECFDCPYTYGFPISFYSVAGNFGPAGKFVESSFNLGFLILDIILIYLVSCLIIKIYSKIKK